MSILFPIIGVLHFYLVVSVAYPVMLQNGQLVKDANLASAKIAPHTHKKHHGNRNKAIPKHEAALKNLPPLVEDLLKEWSISNTSQPTTLHLPVQKFWTRGIPKNSSVDNAMRQKKIKNGRTITFAGNGENEVFVELQKQNLLHPPLIVSPYNHAKPGGSKMPTALSWSPSHEDIKYEISEENPVELDMETYNLYTTNEENHEKDYKPLPEIFALDERKKRILDDEGEKSILLQEGEIKKKKMSAFSSKIDIGLASEHEPIGTTTDSKNYVDLINNEDDDFSEGLQIEEAEESGKYKLSSIERDETIYLDAIENDNNFKTTTESFRTTTIELYLQPEKKKCNQVVKIYINLKGDDESGKHIDPNARYHDPSYDPCTSTTEKSLDIEDDTTKLDQEEDSLESIESMEEAATDKATSTPTTSVPYSNRDGTTKKHSSTTTSTPTAQPTTVKPTTKRYEIYDSVEPDYVDVDDEGRRYLLDDYRDLALRRALSHNIFFHNVHMHG